MQAIKERLYLLVMAFVLMIQAILYLFGIDTFIVDDDFKKGVKYGGH